MADPPEPTILQFTTLEEVTRFLESNSFPPQLLDSLTLDSLEALIYSQTGREYFLTAGEAFSLYQFIYFTRKNFIEENAVPTPDLVSVLNTMREKLFEQLPNIPLVKKLKTVQEITALHHHLRQGTVLDTKPSPIQTLITCCNKNNLAVIFKEEIELLETYLQQEA